MRDCWRWGRVVDNDVRTVRAEAELGVATYRCAGIAGPAGEQRKIEADHMPFGGTEERSQYPARRGGGFSSFRPPVARFSMRIVHRSSFIVLNLMSLFFIPSCASFCRGRQRQRERESVRERESLPLINNKGRRGSDNSCGSSGKQQQPGQFVLQVLQVELARQRREQMSF